MAPLHADELLYHLRRHTLLFSGCVLPVGVLVDLKLQDKLVFISGSTKGYWKDYRRMFDSRRRESNHPWLQESAEAKGISEAEFVSEFFRETEPDSLLQRFIEPEEIAAVVALIASPCSAAINGASIKAEGGLIKSIV